MYANFTCESRALALDPIALNAQLASTMLALNGMMLALNSITLALNPLSLNTLHVLNLHLTSVTLEFNPLSLNARGVRSLYHSWIMQAEHARSGLKPRMYESSGFKPTTCSQYDLVKDQRYANIAQSGTWHTWPGMIHEWYRLRTPRALVIGG